MTYKLLAAAFAACGLGLSLFGPDHTAVSPADPSSPASFDPVIFLAGYDTSGQTTDSCTDGESSFSQEIKESLVDIGYPEEILIDFCYNNGSQDLHKTSVELGNFVAQTLRETHHTHVNIVGYSMGGLPAYECVASGACHNHVEHFVGISSPFQGTTLAGLICNNEPSHPCTQMQPVSDYISALTSSTPSGARTWTVIRAFSDDVVPSRSTHLPGVDSITIEENNEGGPAISGFGLTNHGAMPHNARTVSAVITALSPIV